MKEAMSTQSPACTGNVGLDDIASMHPSSLIAEKHFGKYTKNFEDLKNGCVDIKHRHRSTEKTAGMANWFHSQRLSWPVLPIILGMTWLTR